MLSDNPLLTVLGRRGRAAVVELLREQPERTWTVRAIAREADIPTMAASRSVIELEALGVVESLRPGRDKLVRWEPSSAVARALGPFVVPDLRRESVQAAAAVLRPLIGGQLVYWTMPDDDPADPLVPARLAWIVRAAHEEEAWNHVGAALDAASAAGWPKPDITVFSSSGLGDDAVARCIRSGLVLG